MNVRSGSANNLFRFSHSLLALEEDDLTNQRLDGLDSSKLSAFSVAKSYDYTLKFLLVGDSDVGKEEILNGLNEEEEDEHNDSSFCGSPGVNYKSTVILLDGKRIRLQLWDTSGQGRFSTIIRSYSRGAQGILLVYDITNKWSFSGLNRWLQEVAEHAPGVPKILLGNRLHLAFKRQIGEHQAQAYAHKHNMSFFEVSPLCNYNIRESFTELSRIVLQRHGMESLWKHNTVLSLQELCCRAIVAQTTVYGIEQLPLPPSMKSNLKSFSTMSSYNLMRPFYHHHIHHQKDNTLKRKAKALFACDASPSSGRSRSSSSKGAVVNVESHQRASRSKNCTIS